MRLQSIMKTFYHGTSKVAWDSIKLHGLIPGAGHGADYWTKHSNNIMTLFQFDNVDGMSRPSSVFLTTKQSWANMFAGYAAEVNQSTPVILEVHIPVHMVHMLVEDEAFNPETDAGIAFRFEGTIPPQYIKEHVTHKTTGA